MSLCYVCIVLISNKIGVDNKKTLVNCVKDLYRMGFTHGFRVRNKKWMWITPSGIPRYNLHATLACNRHTHSPYTLGIAISVIGKFQHIIEEAKIVVGNPVLISNKPSRPADLANLVSEAFRHGGEYLRAVIIKNHGVVAVGSDMLL